MAAGLLLIQFLYYKYSLSLPALLIAQFLVKRRCPVNNIPVNMSLPAFLIMLFPLPSSCKIHITVGGAFLKQAFFFF